MKRTALALVMALVLFGCNSSFTTSVPPSDVPDVPPASRKGAPDFNLENVAGGLTKADELNGKVSVIDFWATCGQPCIVEIPNFNLLHEEYKGKDVNVIAITVESAHDDIAPKVKETGMRYPVLVGNDEVVDGFGGIVGFPTTFVVTKDWKVYKRYMGALPDKRARIKKDIEKLLAEESSTTD